MYEVLVREMKRAETDPAVRVVLFQAEGDTFVNIENVTGSQYRDTLFGTDGRNTINGGGGDEPLLDVVGSR